MLECVRRAEQQLLENPAPRNYLPIDGMQAYDRAVQELVFGASDSRSQGRARRHGAGARRHRRAQGRRRSAAPGESGRAGLDQRPELGEPSRAVRIRRVPASAPIRTTTRRRTASISTRMLEALEELPARSIVVLHACCHNPTGVDLKPEQWARVIEVVKARELVPSSTSPTRVSPTGSMPTPRRCAASRKARAGRSSRARSRNRSRCTASASARSASSTESADEAARVLSQVKRVIRTNYSSPPTTAARPSRRC